jgi:hypothetical protein
VVAKRAADLKYFSDHYLGANVARPTVLIGNAANEIEYFAKREKVDLIMLPRTHQGIGSRPATRFADGHDPRAIRSFGVDDRASRYCRQNIH